jgi:nucleoid-associated protein YgaU
MGFLDNVKDALRDALSTQASKDEGASKKDPVVADNADKTADEPPTSATPAPPTIPAGTESTGAADETAARKVAEEDRQETREAKLETYTVKSGDSLSEIGARFGVSRQEIAKLNNIENPDLIFPGQVFRIPKN